jgi:hypothetical protein
MRVLFSYIKTRLSQRVPELRTIRMFNNQTLHGNEKPIKEKAFKYPACFIEFQIQETFNRCYKVVDYLLIVRFRFAVEGYKFERLETFDFCDRVKAALQLMAPVPLSMAYYEAPENNPLYFFQQSETRPVYAHDQFVLTFTTFQEITTDFDEDWDNVEQPYIDYRTLYRSTVAYPALRMITLTDILTPVDVTTNL